VDSESIARVRENWKGEKNETRYLESFVAMANKGLYSYDIETYERSGLAYFRVATPSSPINLNELPEDIRRVVARTHLDLRLARCRTVDYQATLEI
jgi:hypothetical protein